MRQKAGAAWLQQNSRMKEQSKVRKIAFVGDHLPRKCGIATFTTDLRCAVALVSAADGVPSAR